MYIQENDTPKVMPDKHTPHSISDKLKAELDQLTNIGVTAKVDTPTPWLSQVAVALWI